MASDRQPCPHCGSILEPAPRSSRKCPDCREPIVVRTRAGERLLFTPAGAESYDQQRQREVAGNKARRHARNIGIEDAAWQKAEEELTERFGQPASAGDVFWSLANQSVVEVLAEPDWHRARMTYFTMALHLRDEGRDFRHLRQEATRCEVRSHIEQAKALGGGEPTLRVLGCRPDCEVCAPDADRTFQASELLTDDAPIPHDCEWCACGLRFDDAWLDQQRPTALDAPGPSDASVRSRGLFGWRRRG